MARPTPGEPGALDRLRGLEGGPGSPAGVAAPGGLTGGSPPGAGGDAQSLGPSGYPPTGPTVARPGRIRRWGTLLGVVPPLVLLGLAAAIRLVWPCEGVACVEPYAFSYLLIVLALPTALVVGLPWTWGPATIAITLGTAVALWLLVGAWSGRRATADVDAGWPDYWQELATLTAGILAGVTVGLIGASLFFLA